MTEQLVGERVYFQVDIFRKENQYSHVWYPVGCYELRSEAQAHVDRAEQRGKQARIVETTQSPELFYAAREQVG